MSDKKKIVVTGATGLIGRSLIERLINKNYEIVVLTRNIEKGKHVLPYDINFVKWDYSNTVVDKYIEHLDSAYGVVHLAGEPIFNRRWTEKFKKKIYESRIDSTEHVAKIIDACEVKPVVFVSASAIGYYGSEMDGLKTEESSPGTDFLSKVCVEWEKESSKIRSNSTRIINTRFGIILSREGGMLKKLLVPFKLGIGSVIGNPDKYINWVSLVDVVDILVYCLENKAVKGKINVVSPGRTTNKGFAKTLGKVLNRPVLFRIPSVLMKIALGEGMELAEGNPEVSSERIISLGYRFKHDDLERFLEKELKQ